MRITHILAKTLLWLIEKGASLKRPLSFVGNILAAPFRMVGKWLVFPIILFVYDWYLKSKRAIQRIIPPKNALLFLLTRRASIHIMVGVIALSAVTTNLMAKEALMGEERTSASTRLLFSLLPPAEEYDTPAVPTDALGYDELSQEDLSILPQEEPLPPDLGEQDIASASPFVIPPVPPTRHEIITYTIAPGDTLSTIAEKFGISITTIIGENKLASANAVLRPGIELRILPVTGISYLVRANDTLGGIARRFSSTIEKIQDFNQLNDTQLVAGKTLIIPDGKIVAPRSIAYSAPPFAPREVILRAGANMVWPSAGRHVTQYFSWHHPGIDIATGMGVPHFAVLPGKVTFSGWQKGYGLTVMIDHGNGLVTRYAHHSRILVDVGEEVQKGQVIGLEGSTGHSTGPHLHFEVIVNRTRVNPLQFFR